MSQQKHHIDRLMAEAQAARRIAVRWKSVAMTNKVAADTAYDAACREVEFADRMIEDARQMMTAMERQA